MTKRKTESSPFSNHQEYYALPLEQRFSHYHQWATHAYAQKKIILAPLHSYDHAEKGLTPEQLTKELRTLIPSFQGKVLRRDYNGWPSYVIHSSSMHALFGESLFGTITGKVLTAEDTLLARNHKDLAGQIILIAEQEHEEKEGFIAAHEGYHRDHSFYPNALRRDHYYRRALRTPRSPNIFAQTLIKLNQAIHIDEAGAVLSSYAWLALRIHKPWKPGGKGATYNTALLQDWYNTFDLPTELSNTKNELGFKLSALRTSERLSQKNVQAINEHEMQTMLFPLTIRKAAETLSHALQNPEGLDSHSYALSYLEEALQILDFNELMDEKLVPFCTDLLEPYRLHSWGGFGNALADALRGK